MVSVMGVRAYEIGNQYPTSEIPRMYIKNTLQMQIIGNISRTIMQYGTGH